MDVKKKKKEAVNIVRGTLVIGSVSATIYNHDKRKPKVNEEMLV
jgi:hypothetical protein